jgi:hypothetical protein
MAGFGWSVGDLALGIKFVVKIGRALKETGGASSDYQESVEFLHDLELTLSNLKQLVPQSPRGAPAEVITTQAKRIQSSLTVFMKSIEGFEESLGAGRKIGLHHGVIHKMEWAAFVSKKAKDLQHNITLPMSTINSNLSIQVL